MRAKLVKVPVSQGYSFSVCQLAGAQLYHHLHFHPEIEIVYIQRGELVLRAGNCRRVFKGGDLVIMGTNLPHRWKLNAEAPPDVESAQVKVTAIHFSPDIFGQVFMNMPENKALKDFFNAVKYGIAICGEAAGAAARILQTFHKATPDFRLVFLLELLHHMANSKCREQLNSQDNSMQEGATCVERIAHVLEYMENHYCEKIRLKDLADIANLSPNAFCRFFKMSTRKTFSNYLLDMRTDHTCRLLVESNKPIADISNESGFANLSNFNRHFKRVKHLTPLQYRNRHRI